MRLLLFVLVATVVFFQAVSFAEEVKSPEPGAAEFKIHGPLYTAFGYEIGCVKMVEGLTEDEFNFINSYIAGYITSSNKFLNRQTTSDSGIYARWILNYCLQNRMDNLVIAAQHLDKELNVNPYLK